MSYHEEEEEKKEKKNEEGEKPFCMEHCTSCWKESQLQTDGMGLEPPSLWGHINRPAPETIPPCQDLDTESSINLFYFLRSCVKVDVAVLGSLSLTVCAVSVDVKQCWTLFSSFFLIKTPQTPPHPKQVQMTLPREEEGWRRGRKREGQHVRRWKSKMGYRTRDEQTGAWKKMVTLPTPAHTSTLNENTYAHMKAHARARACTHTHTP